MLHVHLPDWARVSTHVANLCLDSLVTELLAPSFFPFLRFSVFPSATIYTCHCTLTMYLE
jgi:hypothetical protein